MPSEDWVAQHVSDGRGIRIRGDPVSCFTRARSVGCEMVRRGKQEQHSTAQHSTAPRVTRCSACRQAVMLRGRYRRFIVNSRFEECYRRRWCEGASQGAGQGGQGRHRRRYGRLLVVARGNHEDSRQRARPLEACAPRGRSICTIAASGRRPIRRVEWRRRARWEGLVGEGVRG
jgi:hypothetical protein